MVKARYAHATPRLDQDAVTIMLKSEEGNRWVFLLPRPLAIMLEAELRAACEGRDLGADA